MKLKKLIASMCGIAMLSATFAAFSVSASVSMTTAITLSSGTTAVSSTKQCVTVNVTGVSSTWTSGAVYIQVPKGKVASVTITANKGVHYVEDGDNVYLTPTKNVMTTSKAGVCTFDDTKYDVIAVTFASASALATDDGDVLFEIKLPLQTADLEMTVLAQSYMQQKSDNTYYYSTTAKTYVATAGSDTVAEKASSTTASASPYDMTKLGLYTNPDNTADQAVAWTVSVKADGSYDQVNYKVTDNSVSKTTGEQALTGTDGGGDVMYGLAVGWLGSGSTPVNPSATATFSKKG